MGEHLPCRIRDELGRPFVLIMVKFRSRHRVIKIRFSVVARFGDERDQLIAVQIHESNASRTCEDSGGWESEAVVESTFTRTLEDSTFFGGSGSEENWMAEGDAAG